MSNKDRDYLRVRLSAEREAAERATNKHVRRVHLQLAEQYLERLTGANLAADHAHDEA